MDRAGLSSSSRYRRRSKFLKAIARRWYVTFWKSPCGDVVFSPGWTFGTVSVRAPQGAAAFERTFRRIKSIRGYQSRSLGPRSPCRSAKENDEDGPCQRQCARLIRRDAIGGSQELIFNTEIIFPIIEGLGLKGVVFFDAGEAFLASQGIDFPEFRTAAGFGLRWLSPIGPLRIEIGFLLNPRVGDDTQAVLFSFGGPP